MPGRTTPQCVEVGLHAGGDTPRGQPGGLPGADHFEVLEAVPAADHLRLCARAQMGVDVLGGQILVAAAVRRIVVRAAQTRCARTQRAVYEQVARKPAGAGRPMSPRASAAVQTAARTW
jgi:hypothetical protein